ncbi:ATP-binding protein [Kitasatospora sp. NPDC004240]
MPGGPQQGHRAGRTHEGTRRGAGTAVPRAVRLPLAGRPGMVAECRALARAVLADWPGRAGPLGRRSPGAATRDEAVLLVSELVTNACRHGRAPMELALIRRPRGLRVEVSDANPMPPRPRPRRGPEEPGGVGLRLLAVLALRWGWQPHGAGKTVWFEVRPPP